MKCISNVLSVNPYTICRRSLVKTININDELRYCES